MGICSKNTTYLEKLTIRILCVTIPLTYPLKKHLFTAAYLGLGHIDKSTALYRTQGQELTVKYDPGSPVGRMDLCVTPKHSTVQVQDCTTVGSYRGNNSFIFCHKDIEINSNNTGFLLSLLCLQG